MPRIQPIDPATATGETAAHLATTRKMFGGTPNVFLTAGNSAPILGAMNAMFANVGKASLGPKIGEQIAIAVSQSNRCGYCVSAHTAIGKMVGVDAAELTAARKAQSVNTKTAAILGLAVTINQARGHVPHAALAEARKAGISDLEIVEIVGHVGLAVFTNYLNNVSETTIDFPVIALDAA
jgi:uncharacterized peroxidase-related enzyme